MTKYICTAPEYMGKDLEGKEVGMQPKRVLCYDPNIGRKRLYRQDINKQDQNLKILRFESEKGAQHACDCINESYSDKFVVEEIEADIEK